MLVVQGVIDHSPAARALDPSKAFEDPEMLCVILRIPRPPTRLERSQTQRPVVARKENFHGVGVRLSQSTITEIQSSMVLLAKIGKKSHILEGLAVPRPYITACDYRC